MLIIIFVVLNQRLKQTKPNQIVEPVSQLSSGVTYRKMETSEELIFTFKTALQKPVGGVKEAASIFNNSLWSQLRGLHSSHSDGCVECGLWSDVARIARQQGQSTLWQ